MLPTIFSFHIDDCGKIGLIFYSPPPKKSVAYCKRGKCERPCLLVLQSWRKLNLCYVAIRSFQDPKSGALQMLPYRRVTGQIQFVF
jgi:hypothetical protein